LFDGITYPAILTVWSLFLLCCCVGAIRSVINPGLSISISAGAKTASLTILLIGVIGFILCATLATALLYPPNTWDSMTYHMPRVMHWITNANIGFYPTANSRQ